MDLLKELLLTFIFLIFMILFYHFLFLYNNNIINFVYYAAILLDLHYILLVFVFYSYNILNRLNFFPLIFSPIISFFLFDVFRFLFVG